MHCSVLSIIDYQWRGKEAEEIQAFIRAGSSGLSGILCIELYLGHSICILALILERRGESLSGGILSFFFFSSAGGRFIRGYLCWADCEHHFYKKLNISNFSKKFASEKVAEGMEGSGNLDSYED